MCGLLRGEETSSSGQIDIHEGTNVAEVGPSTTDQIPQRQTLVTFDQRRKAVLEAFASNPSHHEGFTKALCLFELGRDAEALKEINLALDTLEPGNKINRWMHGGNTGFTAWPGLDCYIRYEGRLDAATKERYRRIYTGGVFYAGLTTSNHRMMAAASRYLATQIWGPNAFHADPWFMKNDPYIQEQTAKMLLKAQSSKSKLPGDVWGTFFSADDPTGEKHLRSVIRFTVGNGPGEYASRPYGAQNILPLLTIADCANEPTMRDSARIAYETCLIQLAPAWLNGLLATFAPRSYPDMENQHAWGVATLPWLYFGGITPELSSAKAASRAATDPYQLPSVILPAGTDRSKPYFYRAFINNFALNHYITSNYALFSHSPKRGGQPFQGQSYPCGVMWTDPDPNHGTQLWITNPCADDPYTTHGLHTHGVRFNAEELLARDALLFLFDSKNDPKIMPYLLGYVPGGYRASINDSATTGRIFIHYGSTLIALTASQPFDWRPEAGIFAPASPPRNGDSEFRVRASQSAVLLETASPEEFPGKSPQDQLTAFRQSILAKSSLKLVPGVHLSAEATTRHGDLMHCDYDGQDSINGKPLDYAAWPVLESPWTSQKIPDGPLEVTDGKTVRTYDFKNWSVSELSK